MKDRGLIKWQGFFMPEHKKMLKEAEIEDMKLKKPTLDEGQLQEINDLLVQSVQDELEIILTLWFDGFIEEIGPLVIYKIDPYQRKLHVRYNKGTQIFRFDSIIGARSN